MLQKASMLLLVLAGMAACVSCGSVANHYVYATIPSANQIAAFREDPNSGILTEIDGSPYSVGEGAHSIVVHPSQKYLYVANPGEGANGEDDISLFTVNRDGTLTEATTRTPLGSAASLPQILVMDPAGAYLYSMNAGTNNISVFSINSGTGVLTQVTSSPVPIGFSPQNMVVTPSGGFLYVSGVGETTGLIAGFSANAGQLTSIGAPVSSDGINPYGLAVSPNGSYLYAANSSSSSNSIAIFSIASSGVLAEVQGSPIAEGYANPIAMAFDPAGKFLYVVNQGSANVSVYSIASTGLPTSFNTATTTNSYGTETDPSSIVVDPNGKFLFVGNQVSGAGIQPFSISNGVLNGLHIYGVGEYPSSMAVLQ